MRGKVNCGGGGGPEGARGNESGGRQQNVGAKNRIKAEKFKVNLEGDLRSLYIRDFFISFFKEVGNMGYLASFT